MNCEIEAYPYGKLGVELRVPVAVEVPEALLDVARGQYKLAQLRGSDPDFADYLHDVIRFEPTFVVDDEPIDMDTGWIEDEEVDE